MTTDLPMCANSPVLGMSIPVFSFLDAQPQGTSGNTGFALVLQSKSLEILTLGDNR
jgi:hypothetical protein